MKILIVEDHIELRNELKILLEDSNYEVIILTSFTNSKENILKIKPDLILLDIGIPHIDGQQLLREIRKESDMPVIMLTSRSAEKDEVTSMTYGADDYITKPYNPTLLVLRIEAVLKRFNKSNQDIFYRHYKIDITKNTIESHDKELILTKNEMGIFYSLLKNKGNIVLRDDIMNYLWGSNIFIDNNTLTVNVSRLRKKLEQLELYHVIETKKDQGYILL